MRVTLCYPAVLPGYKPRYGLQPLGILYIAALLRREGFTVAVLDADIEGLTIAETARRILETAPDLIGFSLMTPQLHAALACCATLKELRPDLPIVLGGAHIDSTKDDVFAMSAGGPAPPLFDFAIHGEGEWALVDCCRRLVDHGVRGAHGIENLTECIGDVANVIVRDPQHAGRVIVRPARPFLDDLDSLPSVDYAMLAQEYRFPMLPGRHVISMMASRGCPFSCTFCDAPIVMGKKIRFWSVSRLIEDIRRYKEMHGTSSFVFKDSTFTANSKWAEAFCRGLLDADVRIQWRCNTRAEQVPQPLLSLMARAGCHVINFGVESGDEEILSRIRKEVDLASVVDAFERCRTVGIRTYATLLVGSPGETEESVRRTIDFAKRIRPGLCTFHIAVAYPGTPMYDEAAARGEITPRWWSNWAYDPTRQSAFQFVHGWTTAGSLQFENGLDAEHWQRRAMYEWYLRPRFVWDTLTFTMRNPYFLAHLWTVGREMIPFYRLRNFLRQRPPTDDAHLRVLSQCPSKPTWDYEPRVSVVNGVARYHQASLSQEPCGRS